MLQKAVQTALRIMGRLRALLTLALLPLFTPSLGAQSVAIMESDHLRRSMRGYGLTTFQGTQIDTFQVEILGVMKAVRKPHMDRILARFTGGPLEHTGVIAGMSGSPVYIDGRLIGAVSHGWTLSKDPIGGITPITDMLEVARRPDTDPKQTYGRPIELDAVEEYITLDLPADLEPGPLVLRVGSGTASEAWEAVRRPDGFHAT